MDSHPLAKILVGFLGVTIIAVAMWFGRTGGSIPDAETPDLPIKSDTPASPPEKEKYVRPPISATGPYPKVTIDKLQHDFSVVVVGSDGSHAFKIQNTGEAPLLLAKGPTTCKCTISDLDEGEVAPGESATIDVAWKARAVNPQFQQTATIYTNDPEMKELELKVSGQITKLIEVSPQGRWPLADTSADDALKVTGTIFSYVLDSIELAKTEDSSEHLSVEFEPMSVKRLKSLRAKSGSLVRVSVNSKIPVGQFREKLGIKVLNQEMEPIEVYIEGSRSGPISFLRRGRTRWNPTAMLINIGDFEAKNGATAGLLLFVRGLKDTEFEFTSVKTDPKDLQIELKPDPDFAGAGRKKYELEFKLPPGITAERRTGQRPAVVEVETNHPEAKTLKFRLNYISRD